MPRCSEWCSYLPSCTSRDGGIGGRASERRGATSKRLSRIQQAQLFPPHIPMPGLDADAGIRVLERLVLQPAGVKPQGPAQLQQPFLVRAHQMDHRFVADLVAVKPNAAVEGEAHPLPAALEFPIRRL